MSSTTIHIPILVQPIVEHLLAGARNRLQAGFTPWIVDCTLGGGGHTSACIATAQADQELGARVKFLALDQDEQAIARATERFRAEIEEGKLVLAHSRFSELSSVLASHGLTGQVAGLLADLGYSSDQLENAERGISFLRDGPLDMRMDMTRPHSARDILQTFSETDIANLIWEYGEDRFSRKIAHRIVEARRRGELPKTTAELARLVEGAFPPAARHGRIHAATRTFQALRIVVNQELEELDALLDQGADELGYGGRMAIMSFHSLEDRKVKQWFKAHDALENLTKKPFEADDAEVEMNPRSRSAKLRVAEKLA